MTFDEINGTPDPAILRARRDELSELEGRGPEENMELSLLTQVLASYVEPEIGEDGL